jgi:hypothetical protein
MPCSAVLDAVRVVVVRSEKMEEIPSFQMVSGMFFRDCWEPSYVDRQETLHVRRRKSNVCCEKEAKRDDLRATKMMFTLARMLISVCCLAAVADTKKN